jgi:protein-S-isoprenylcysteine O-methyltransferase Ste14
MNLLPAILFSLLTTAAGFWVFRVKVREDYRQLRKLTPLSTWLEILVFVLHANLMYIFLPGPCPELPPFPRNPIHRAGSALLIIGGLLLTLSSMSNLGFKKAVGQDTEDLHEKGFYRWTRNPQLIFYGVLLIGWASLYPDWRALIWLLVYGMIAHWMVLTEEKHLENLYGQAYSEYCKQIPRYIGLRRKT